MSVLVLLISVKICEKLVSKIYICCSVSVWLDLINDMSLLMLDILLSFSFIALIIVVFISLISPII